MLRTAAKVDGEELVPAKKRKLATLPNNQCSDYDAKSEEKVSSQKDFGGNNPKVPNSPTSSSDGYGPNSPPFNSGEPLSPPSPDTLPSPVYTPV